MGGSIRALVALGCVFVTVSAQSITLPLFSQTPTRSGAASSSTASSGPKVVDVTVNKGSTHKFAPEEIEANVGDVISFHFFPTNHSVVKAEYGCEYGRT
jgi:plastocyanin